MFSIKICGITRVEDAVAAAEAGADAIGLNFYPKSPRATGRDRTHEIVAALPESVRRVGLFVNAEPAFICDLFDELNLDMIQLHGDEPPELVAALGGRSVVKAFRTSGVEGLSLILGYLDACRSLGCLPEMLLLDAPAAGSFGGTGKLADWALAREIRASREAPPLVLAGGLRPENVAAAVQATGVRAVDTASGVETLPGIKDAEAVKDFVHAARNVLTANR